MGWRDKADKQATDRKNKEQGNPNGKWVVKNGKKYWVPN